MVMSDDTRKRHFGDVKRGQEFKAGSKAAEGAGPHSACLRCEVKGRLLAFAKRFGASAGRSAGGGPTLAEAELAPTSTNVSSGTLLIQTARSPSTPPVPWSTRRHR